MAILVRLRRYQTDIFVTLSALPTFLRGALNTLLYCAASFLIALLVGLVLMMMTQSRFIWLRMPARIFIEVMRGTPIITQILLLYLYFGGL